MSTTALIFVGDDPALCEKAQKMLFEAGFDWGFNYKRVINSQAYVLILEGNRISWLSSAGYSPLSGFGGLGVKDTDRLPILIAKTMTQEEVNMLPFANSKPEIEVRELTMEQLNDLSEKTFGYQIKIRK